ncbi:MAG: hypothetical protein ABIO99_00575 [Candidatus Limnocylindria bacterium]
MRRIIVVLGVLPILLLALVPSALAARPSTGFTGLWEAIDPGDGSNLYAVIAGASTTQILYTDDNATSACADASTPEFTSLLVGKVDGAEMHSTMTIAKCGTQPLTFVHGLEIVWYLDDGGNGNLADDVLYNSFGEEFTRSN